MRRVGVAAALGLAIAALAAPGAMAATYCVTAPGGTAPACPSGGTPSVTLDAALAAADASTTTDDTVLLGPGTFPEAAPANYFNGHTGAAGVNDVTIQGAGEGQTIVAGTSAAALQVLNFAAAAPNNVEQVQDLTVTMPDGFNGVGIARATNVEGVSVTAVGGLGGSAVAVLAGGKGTDAVSTISGLHVALPLADAANDLVQAPQGIFAQLDGAQTGLVINVSDSSITSGYPILLGTDVRLIARRDRLHGRTGGVLAHFPAVGNLDNVIEDSQIVLDSPDPTAAIQVDTSSAAATLAVRHVTAKSVPAASTLDGAVRVVGSHTADVRIRNSILTGFTNAITGVQSVAATVAISNSVLPTASDPAMPNITITRSDPNVAGDPHLVDDGSGNLYPRSDSPALELGDLQFTNNPTDLLGQGRVIDANGDGTSLPDAGAIEYQRRAPTVTASGPPLALANSPITFLGGGTDPDPGDALTFTWVFSDGTTSAEQNPVHAFPAGRYSATLTVRDPTGLSASSTVTGASVAPPPPPPAPDKTAPALSHVGFSPKTFRASADTSTATSAATKKSPVGSTLKLTLSEAGTLTIVIDQKRSGRLSGKTCKAETSKTRKAKKCTYYTKRATLTRKDIAAGARSFQFTGRVSGKALPAGSYRATITAKDAAKNVSKAATATFTLASK